MIEYYIKLWSFWAFLILLVFFFWGLATNTFSDYWIARQAEKKQK